MYASKNERVYNICQGIDRSVSLRESIIPAIAKFESHRRTIVVREQLVTLNPTEAALYQLGPVCPFIALS